MLGNILKKIFCTEKTNALYMIFRTALSRLLLTIKKYFNF